VPTLLYSTAVISFTIPFIILTTRLKVIDINYGFSPNDYPEQNRIECIYILQILFSTRMWNKLSQNYLKTLIYNKLRSPSPYCYNIPTLQLCHIYFLTNMSRHTKCNLKK
jgi:hypothetical protein